MLTQISLFWFDFLKDIVANHLVTADVDQYPAELQQYADQLRGRSMLVMRADMVPVECVVRGYLSGSGWKEYKATGDGLRHPVAGGTARIGQVARADLHPCDQGDDRP